MNQISCLKRLLKIIKQGMLSSNSPLRFLNIYHFTKKIFFTLKHSFYFLSHSIKRVLNIIILLFNE